MPALDAGIFFWRSGEDDRIKAGHDEKEEESLSKSHRLSLPNAGNFIARSSGSIPMVLPAT